MQVVHDDLEVCERCLAYVANGQDVTGEHAARMREQWGDQLRHMVQACPQDCEGWFSWSECDGCADTSGGMRHPAAVLGEGPEPVEVRRQYCGDGDRDLTGEMYAEDDATEVRWWTEGGSAWLVVIRSPRGLWQIETSDLFEVKISYYRKRFRTLAEVFSFAAARAGGPVVEVEEW